MNRYVYLLKSFCRNLHHEISQNQNILIWNKNGGCQWQNLEYKYVQINKLKYVIFLVMSSDDEEGDNR